ncbi:sensor histidine kinase [Corynebacterium variabile]|uniref:histidine kinase n=1 Tax=Corynebacterium variabile TaxID=1727 RepID=A0A4Y4C6N1_9CORY|nr:histidine kinase [Corynebacterium variabile]MDN6536237.1 histidine kinase [Corynebacterium variabile]GEC87519.1 two-component sensor histidine kinase [Corynebacterium variabile]
MSPIERSSVDLLVAVGTAVVGLGVLAVFGVIVGTEPSEYTTPTTMFWYMTAVVLVLQAATQLLPRTYGQVLLVAAALPVVVAVVAPGALFSVTALPILVCAFLTGLHVPFRQLRWVVPGAALLVAAGHLINALSSDQVDVAGAVFEAVLQAVLVIGLPLLPATAIAAQKTARRAQQQTLEALARERDAQIGKTLALERTAMARELHDIAAHHVSGISLMASVVERQIRSDPDAARTGVAAVRQQSKAVLDDLRRLVGLLRDADGSDDAIKTLATVPALVEAMSATGADIRLDIRRTVPDSMGEGIGPLAQLAAYRMVQESLTNASRYARSAACTVVIDDTDPSQLLVIVRNTRPAPGTTVAESGSGFGILGMQERAALIGGTFDAGPTGDDGWETRMSIPRESFPDEQEESL